MAGKIPKVEFAKDSKWVANYGRHGEFFISRNLAGTPDFEWLKIFQDIWYKTIMPRRGFESVSGSLNIYPTVPDDATSAKIVAEAALKHTNEEIERINAETEKDAEEQKKLDDEAKEKRRKQLEEIQRKLDAS